jgi:protein-L-isoaspartate O-methyltransferase
LFFLPPHLRRRAAARLNLKPGHRVLEIGCGTGRNFAFLREAVGPSGKVYGVDLSTGMLRRARALCRREQWANVELTHGDAIEYICCEPLDGILSAFATTPCRTTSRCCTTHGRSCVRADASSSWTASFHPASAASWSCHSVSG